MRKILISLLVGITILVTATIMLKVRENAIFFNDELWEVSRRAEDLSSPLTRRQNEKVIVELEAYEVKGELAPGVTYEYWTYNGKVPGPFIRVKEGDTVEIRLTHGHKHGQSHALNQNIFSIAQAHEPEEEIDDAHRVQHEKEGHSKHSIDLHAVEGPGGGSVFTQVGPGETRSFEFKALRPGLYVYHCASPHIPTHVANGMYGLILVEPEVGLPPVDHEFYVMQGEFYTAGKRGEKGHQEFSLEKLLEEKPEYVVFNGRTGGMTSERSMKVKVGEKIRIYFGVGSHIASNFHIIGGILDKLYPEGDIISPPHRNVQTTIVPPGGAMVVEFTLEVPGKYLIVDHSLSRAIDKGAVGEIIVEGNDRPEIFRSLNL